MDSDHEDTLMKKMDNDHEDTLMKKKTHASSKTAGDTVHDNEGKLLHMQASHPRGLSSSNQGT